MGRDCDDEFQPGRRQVQSLHATAGTSLMAARGGALRKNQLVDLARAVDSLRDGFPAGAEDFLQLDLPRTLRHWGLRAVIQFTSARWLSGLRVPLPGWRWAAMRWAVVLISCGPEHPPEAHRSLRISAFQISAFRGIINTLPFPARPCFAPVFFSEAVSGLWRLSTQRP